MGHKNYKKYSEYSDNKKQIIREPIQIIENENVIEDIVEEAVNEITSKEFLGVVSGCEKLNIRSKDSLDSDVLCVIEKDAEVVVDLNGEAVNGFYKVHTASGVEGYCMTEYIILMAK